MIIRYLIFWHKDWIYYSITNHLQKIIFMKKILMIVIAAGFIFSLVSCTSYREIGCPANQPAYKYRGR